MILIPWSIPLAVLFYMWGGQTMKWIRPVGVALSISGIYFVHHFIDKSPDPWWWGFLAWSLGFELAFGYGEKSWIAKFDKQNDTETRIIYALWVSLGISIACLVCNNPWALFGMPLVIGAFQIRAGSAFKIGNFDFLWEDLARSLAIAISMNWALKMF